MNDKNAYIIIKYSVSANDDYIIVNMILDLD